MCVCAHEGNTHSPWLQIVPIFAWLKEGQVVNELQRIASKKRNIIDDELLIFQLDVWAYLIVHYRDYANDMRAVAITDQN